MSEGTALHFVRRALTWGRRALWFALLVGGLLLFAWFRLWRPVEVEVVLVERGAVVQEAFGRGTVESQREAAVGFDMVGRLSEVLVEEGARVTLGQALARLETTQVEADLLSAQTGVDAARASLLRLAGEEDRARVLLAAAERDAARMRSLFETGAVPGQQRDDANDRLRVARTDLDRVLAQRSEATRGIEVAASGAEQRRVTMVRATLLAPFDGLVTRRLREPGDTVAIGSVVLRIVDTSRVFINAAMDETMLPMLAVEQVGSVAFPGTETPVPGRVTRIAWEADRQTHELLVEVTPDRLERRVAIGQRADVHVEVARHEQVLRVPIRMLHQDSTGPFVYIDRGGKIGIVRPRFGLAGMKEIEVLAGLAEGDTLLAGSSRAAELPSGRRWVAR